MSFNSKGLNEEIALITEASSSSDQKRLEELSNCVYMNVRKAVARNRNTSSTIINKMAEIEISANVLYWLLQKPSCRTNRTISKDDLANRCTTCDVSELNLNNSCVTCTR